MSAFISGLSLGLSLILAIGAQNAFVLKQGLKKDNIFVICLICATSDALLITAGILGFGIIIKEAPIVETLARYGGALFLTIYGIQSLISSWKNSHALYSDKKKSLSLKDSVLICLAFTWLNPHVYLDTVVLMGSVSSQFEGEKIYFGLGAITASFSFFFLLGYGARILKPFFEKPKAWSILELFVGITMLSIAGILIFPSNI